MRIDVTTIDDVTISRWRWWSNWIDICVFEYQGGSYLVQMKISRTNSKWFKTVRIGGAFKCLYPREIESLTPMKKEPHNE